MSILKYTDSLIYIYLYTHKLIYLYGGEDNNKHKD